MSYCLSCEKEVVRCWNTSSGCSGNGHCMDCGGYKIETEEQKEIREGNEHLTKLLVER